MLNEISQNQKDKYGMYSFIKKNDMNRNGLLLGKGEPAGARRGK
jgi:hypothetical protein